jgi:putative tryptophan/tyrosine transport system substrate-binding protein
MKRREFITLLGGAATTWPVAARAQQGEHLRRIGVLMGGSNDPLGQARAAALVQGLGEFNWHDGGNLRIDWRWAGGNAELYERYARNSSRSTPRCSWSGAARVSLHCGGKPAQSRSS